MADKLVIRKLAATCRLGVFEWEQTSPQDVWIDLTLEIDAASAARHDDVKDAVDYGRLVTAVKQLVEGKSFRLMETMAEEIAALVLKEFPTPAVEVKITKRALPGIESAAVEITRGSSRKSEGFPRA